MPASLALWSRPSSLLFLSSLCFAFSGAARFPCSSSLRFLLFRSSLARFSRSKPSAFLLARFSSSSLTTHGLLSISFRKAVFSAQAAASSFVERIMAVGKRYRVSPFREPWRPADLQTRSSSICLTSLNDPTPPLTLTTVPMSTPLRLTSRPVAVTPLLKASGPLGPVGSSASDKVFAFRIGDVGAGSLQVISIVAPLLSSSSALQRVGKISTATMTPTRRIHLMGWLRWK